MPVKENNSLPVSPKKSTFVSKSITAYIREKGVRENVHLAMIREKTSNHPCAKMQITPEQGQFLAFLAKLTNAVNALEIGVFTGYSALAVAQALPDNGRLIAIDKSIDWTSRAIRFWQEAGVSEKIDLRISDGCEELQNLVNENMSGFFDLIFIDADKKNYTNYYNFAKQLVRRGGMIVVDNTLWRGSVTAKTTDDLAANEMKHFNDMLHLDLDMEICMLPLGDGMTLLLRK